MPKLIQIQELEDDATDVDQLLLMLKTTIFMIVMILLLFILWMISPKPLGNQAMTVGLCDPKIVTTMTMTIMTMTQCTM